MLKSPSLIVKYHIGRRQINGLFTKHREFVPGITNRNPLTSPDWGLEPRPLSTEPHCFQRVVDSTSLSEGKYRSSI